MIKKEMLEKGISLTENVVYEVEVVEFENEDYSCLDAEEVLYFGISEDEAQRVFKEAISYAKSLNDKRGGVQEDGEFFGLRLNEYRLSVKGHYYPYLTLEDYGEYDYRPF